MLEKKRKAAGVHGVSPVDGKVEELWRKGFVEKMSFEFWFCMHLTISSDKYFR